jgi:hypothetical protein
MYVIRVRKNEYDGKQLKVLNWLHEKSIEKRASEKAPTDPDYQYGIDPTMLMECAISEKCVNIIKWATTHGYNNIVSYDSRFTFKTMQSTGRLKNTKLWFIKLNADITVDHTLIDMLGDKIVIPIKYNNTICNSAAEAGRLDIIINMHNNNKDTIDILTLKIAIANGHLGMIKWIYQHYPSLFTTKDIVTYTTDTGKLYDYADLIQTDDYPIGSILKWFETSATIRWGTRSSVATTRSSTRSSVASTRSSTRLTEHSPMTVYSPSPEYSGNSDTGSS